MCRTYLLDLHAAKYLPSKLHTLGHAHEHISVTNLSRAVQR